MLTILLSILCSTLVYAAPTSTHTATVRWNALKDDTTLSRFQSTLLNQTLVTFLNECYTPQPPSAKIDIPDILCSRYFDAVLQLNNTEYVVSQPTLMKLLNESNTDKGFCKQKHTFPAMQYYTTIDKDSSDLSDTDVCGFMCIYLSGKALVPRPICVFLAWMGDEIKNAAVQLPNTPENAPNLNNSSHLLSIARTNPEKPNVPISNNKPSVPLIPSQKNDNVSGNIQHLNESVTVKINNKKIETVQPKEEAIDHKQNVALAEAAAAEIIAPTVNEEKPKSPPQSSPPLETEKAEEEDISKYAANAEKTNLNENPNEEQQPEDSEDQNDNVNPDEGTEEDDDHDIFPKNPKQLHDIFPQKAKQLDDIFPQKPKQLHDTGNSETAIETVDENIMPKVSDVTDPFQEESGSNFFTYFLFGMFLCIVMYVLYHNKSKILALLLEGRRSDKGRGGRRKHTAAYRKLDSNLEEAITSSASGRITQIIY